MSAHAAPPAGHAASREDIRFASAALQCAAWHYRVPNGQTAPCIVMAHGFGATREYRLAAYAERFQASGYAVLLFDYRHFGDSEGMPRGLLDVRKQHEDWEAAISYCRSLGYEKLILWGTSFAGGHVLHLAAHRNDIAAVISQVPHVSGPASAGAVPILATIRLSLAICLDLLLRAAGRRYFVKAFGTPGSVAAMPTPGAYASLIEMLPKDGTGKDGMSWREYFDRHNRVTASSLLQVMFYSPGMQAHRIHCPVLMQAGRNDRTTPFHAAERVSRKIAQCEFVAYDADHFDVYLGSDFNCTIRDQLRFLHQHFPQ